MEKKRFRGISRKKIFVGAPHRGAGLGGGAYRLDWISGNSEAISMRFSEKASLKSVPGGERKGSVEYLWEKFSHEGVLWGGGGPGGWGDHTYWTGSQAILKRFRCGFQGPLPKVFLGAIRKGSVEYLGEKIW